MNDPQKLASKFRVPGKPVGKQSVQGNIKTKHFYKPIKTRNYERLVAFHARQCMKEHGKRLSGEDVPVLVEITIYYEIPKSYSKTKKLNAAMGLISPTKKPDVDNVSKSVHDAMEGVVYENDKQIVKSIVNKFYASEWSIEVEFYEI